MIDAQTFLSAAKDRGIDFFSGVPCSFLTPLINGALNDENTDYVAAASEGEAVAIAAGAWLAGRSTAVMFQNSGLGNAVNPLTSLNFPFKIPTLIICTWRAAPGLKDEPQHELMGQITPDMFDVMRIPHEAFPSESNSVSTTLDSVIRKMRMNSLPSALIMQKGDVADQDLNSNDDTVIREDGVVDNVCGQGSRPSRFTTLAAMLEVLPEDACVVATTGKCGRELFTLADREQHLYQVGSMGCASGMSLGIALNTDKPVIALDGDGALMMKMGTLATIGAYGPKNLVHIVLDNGAYDSTGGQPTVSPTVDFAKAAVAAGYARGITCDDLDGFCAAVNQALSEKGPALVHMKIMPGSISNLGRPTISPMDAAHRFKKFVCGDHCD